MLELLSYSNKSEEVKDEMGIPGCKGLPTGEERL
jgi:hypothetical protein